MEEIQIGEYVRTNYGIKRIDTIFENRPVNRYGYEIGSDWDGKEYSIIKTTDIVKHSKNIIDLIEVGDIVNNYIVLDTMEDLETGEIHLEMPSSYPKSGSCSLYENEIKTILTHEQYENNCYKIGDD